MIRRLSARYSKANRRSVNAGPVAAGGVITVPTAFVFTDITGAATSTLFTSNTITVIGLDAGISVPALITGPGQYSKNAGAYTAAAGTAVNGDTFSVQVTSSGSAATTVSAQLYIGGRSDTYSVTTA